MKRTLTGILAIAAVSVLGAAAALAGPGAGTGVTGSLHDMNTIRGAAPDVQDRVCAFCHTPHHALTPTDAPMSDYLPLWSHPTNNNNFTPYDSVTFAAKGGKTMGDPLTGPSRLCMSCHDGVIAVDSHYGFTGTKVFTGNSWGQVAIGQNNDVSQTHPIGFMMTDVLPGGANVDPGIRPDVLSNGYLGNQNVKVVDRLWNGAVMTCATCHDVHNKINVANNPGTPNYFVLAPQAGSQLCLTCHDK